MTFPQNVVLYNAAITGYLAGHIKGRRLAGGVPLAQLVNSGTPPAIGTPDPSFAALASEAVSWATAFDALIAPDVSGTPIPSESQYITVVTDGAGVAVAPVNAALAGTVDVVNGSPDVTFSTGQTLPAGAQLVFAEQPSVSYTLESALTGGTAGVLTSNYTGTSAGATTTTAGIGGAVAQAQLAKGRLVEMLSLSAFEERWYASPRQGQFQSALTAAEFAPLAGLISGSYLGTTSLALADIGSNLSGFTNNNLLAQAAFDGFIGGILVGNQGDVGPITQTTLAFATGVGYAFEIDALVPFDSSITISTTNQGALSPGNSLGAESMEVGKTRLMLSIALATIEARTTFSLQQFAGANEAAITAWSQEVAPPVAACYTACVGLANAGAYVPGSPGIVGDGTTPTPQRPTVNGLWNVGLYNEAYCGFIAGVLAGRPITSNKTSDSFYVALAAAAQVFAAQIDLTVGASDVTGADVPTGTQFITLGGDGGANLVPPTTGPVQQGVLGKTGLMWAICRGVMHGRPLLGNALDVTPATYEAISTSIVALYLEMTTALQLPGAT